tara:strand:- start:23185 stop:24303 length:1119 start_codon:yes stop_codon:yes gene_type:complete
LSQGNGGELDIATDLLPHEVVSLFPDSLTHGSRYGTVVVRLPHSDSSWDVTTLRTETNYNDGRRPENVVFGTDIQEDLSRRDFTVNSMAVSYPSGELLDPYNGARDLSNKILKTVGLAEERFSEDGLRIIRAYRFLALSDDWILDPGAELAIQNCIGMLSRISPERIGSEFRKILELPSHRASLLKMQDHGVLEKIVPGARVAEDFSSSGQFAVDLSLMFHQGNGSRDDAILSFENGLAPTKQEVKTLTLLLGLAPCDLLNSNEEIRRFQVSLNTTDREMVLVYLQKLGFNRRRAVSEVDFPKAGSAPLLDGHMLSEITGVGPGQRLGKLKSYLHRLQVEKDLANTEEVLLELDAIDWSGEDHLCWPELAWP